MMISQAQALDVLSVYTVPHQSIRLPCQPILAYMIILSKRISLLASCDDLGRLLKVMRALANFHAKYKSTREERRS